MLQARNHHQHRLLPTDPTQKPHRSKGIQRRAFWQISWICYWDAALVGRKRAKLFTIRELGWLAKLLSTAQVCFQEAHKLNPHHQLSPLSVTMTTRRFACSSKKHLCLSDCHCIHPSLSSGGRTPSLPTFHIMDTLQVTLVLTIIRKQIPTGLSSTQQNTGVYTNVLSMGWASWN